MNAPRDSPKETKQLGAATTVPLREGNRSVTEGSSPVRGETTPSEGAKKGRGSLGPKTSAHGQDTPGSMRKLDPPYLFRGSPKTPTNAAPPTADLQRVLSKQSEMRPLSTMAHSSDGTFEPKVGPVPTASRSETASVQSSGSPANSIDGPALAPQASGGRKGDGHGKTADERERAPTQTVCRISVPYFAGESRHLAVEMTGQVKPAAKANRPTPETKALPDTPRKVQGRIPVGNALPWLRALELATAQTAKLGSRESVDAADFLPRVTLKRKQQPEQPVRRLRDSPEQLEAATAAAEGVGPAHSRRSSATPPSSLLRVNVETDDVDLHKDVQKGGRVSSLSATASRSPSRTSRQSVGKQPIASLVGAVERPQEGLARATSPGSWSSRSSWLGPRSIQHSGVSTPCSQRSSPSRSPTPSCGSIAEGQSVYHHRQSSGFGDPRTWEPRRGGSPVSYASRSPRSDSPLTTSTATPGSLRRLAGRRAVHLACVKASRNVTSTPQSSMMQPSSSDRTFKKFLKKHPTAAILCGLLLTAVVASFLVVLGRIGLDYSRLRSVAASCRTETCNNYARRLVDSVNTTLKPCESFTRFVCDGWRRRNQLSVREEAFLFQLRRMSYLLRSLPVPNKAQNALARAAAFYRSCDAVRTGDADELPKVKAALLQAGIVWPRVPRDSQTVDLLRTWLHTSLKLHWSALLDVSIVRAENTTRVLLEPRGGFRRIWEKHDKLGSNVEEAEDYFETLREDFGSFAELSVEATQGTVNFSVTRDLYGPLLLRLRDSMTLSQHSSILDSAVLFETVPGLTEARWLAELDRYGDGSDHVTFESTQPDYVSTFLELWKVHGERDMHSFLSWCTVQTAALYANRRLLANFYVREDSMDMYHGALCLSKAYLLCGSELFREYFDEMFSDRAMTAARNVVAGTREAFARRLDHWPHRNPNVTVVRDWPSSTFPIEYFNPHFEQPSPEPAPTVSSLGDMGSSLVDNWKLFETNHLDVRYLLAAERIEYAEWFVLLPDYDLALLPYALTFPSFDESGTRSMNQAGLGNYVADALSQLFFYRYRDATDGLSFLRSFECARNASRPRDGPRIYRTVHLLRTLATEVSLEAYRVGSSTEGDARLEAFENYGSVALFFIASCYALCRGSDSLPPFRGDECDEAFRNVQGFAGAFGCDTGSPMNPAVKCALM
ncbi:uncharacterized protein [Dermacentor albipictus]|uniref:uncharacterized protein isoform X2 n=1 Tax=Dermacentor albipictus TaxID=60249 RepID=UPI0038FC30ED